MRLPTIELLSAALGEKVVDTKIDGNKLNYKVENSEWSFINIYELMHKLKVLAYKNGKTLESGYGLKTSWCNIYDGVNVDDGDVPSDYTLDNTELGAVVKACEYIQRRPHNGY